MDSRKFSRWAMIVFLTIFSVIYVTEVYGVTFSPQKNVTALENELDVVEESLDGEIPIPKPENISPPTSQMPWYTEEEFELLSRLVYAEANVWKNYETGCWEYCSDEWQMNVVCVVLNRMHSNKFPNTIKDVIYAPGQYYPAYTPGGLDLVPDERAYENVRRVLDGEYSIPENVVFQAQFLQGTGIYQQIGNTYFCYI